MRPLWWYAALAPAACAAAAFWPLSPALAPADALQTRFYAVIVSAVVCVAASFIRRGSAFWMTVSIVFGCAGLASLMAHFNASAACVAQYGGQPIVIGRTFSEAAADYVRHNPGLGASDLLLDAGGVPDRLWTPESIRTCRFWLSWGGLMAIPLFSACLGGLIERRKFRFSTVLPAPPAARPGRMGSALVYDAFISYRHVEPDKSHACEILEILESHKLRVAIDFRDFIPNEHFLSEMERCIKESRFVLCVVTSSYLDSDHCSEEAIISKTLDMTERRKRIVPLIFERIALPVWLHGLVGIDFGESAAVDPVQRLLKLLLIHPENPQSVVKAPANNATKT